MTTALRLVLAVIAGAASAAFGQLTAITNVSVVDVRAGAIVPGQTVLVEGATIASVVPASSFKPAREATIVDGTGRYLMPGLFDAHVHYIDPGSFGPLFIANGVVFVRDMGNATQMIIGVRDALNSGSMLGPEMVCTGAIVDGDPPVWPFSEPCDTPEQARAAVRKLHAAGVNQIKVYSRLKKDVYMAAVAEARALDLKAVGHIPNSCTVADAIAAGQAGNEHLMAVEKIIGDLVPGKNAGEDRSRGTWPSGRFWFLYPEVNRENLDRELRTLAASGMVQCPTLVVMQGIGSIAGGKADEDPRLVYVSSGLRGFWGGQQYKGFATFAQGTRAYMQSMVGDMHRARVPLMVGTDLANPYVYAGFSVHDELKLLVEAGLSPAEALYAATVRPAQFIGVSDRFGSIEPRKTASFVLLNADPLADIANTTTIEGVWIRGTHHDRTALDAMLDGVRKTVAAATPVKTEVELALPGTPVLEGRYALKFGQFDAGSEQVLITKSADGWSMRAHSDPKGGPQGPSVVTWHTAPDFSLLTASYRELTNSPILAEYRMDGGVVTAEATQGGKTIGAAELPLDKDGVFGPPGVAGDFFVINKLALKVGERREMQTASFGFPDWRPFKAGLTITRAADTQLQRPDGAVVRARLYKLVLDTPGAAMTSETWTDDRGVVLKTIVSGPFGKITAELQP